MICLNRSPDLIWSVWTDQIRSEELSEQISWSDLNCLKRSDQIRRSVQKDLVIWSELFEQIRSDPYFRSESSSDLFRHFFWSDQICLNRSLDLFRQIIRSDLKPNCYTPIFHYKPVYAYIPSFGQNLIFAFVICFSDFQAISCSCW